MLPLCYATTPQIEENHIFLGKQNFVDLFWSHLDVKGRLINSISTSCPPRQDQMIVRQTLGDLLSDGTTFLISFKIPAIRREPPLPLGTVATLTQKA